MDLEDFSVSELDGDVFLVLVDYRDFREVADGMTKKLVDNGLEGIFFSTDRDFKTLEADLEYRDIEMDNLYFIDVVSKMRNLDKDLDNVEMIDSPTAFNDINLAFSKFLDRGNVDFVLLDSFTSYLLYGDLKSIGNFVNSMANKVKKEGSKFLILAMEPQLEENVVEKLESICDRSFDFDNLLDD